MANFGTHGQMEGPSKIAVCPNCDNIMCADYLPSMDCSRCDFPLFSNNLIYMPNLEDAYEIAHEMVQQNIERRLGVQDNDSF